MVEFDKHLDKGTSRKRCFGGATIKQLKYYIEEVLKEETPDKIILCIGTNNLTKTQQNDVEIVNEIICVINKCYASGVNEVYVSSLTVRPSHQKRIDEINRTLKANAWTHNYEFIDNSNILVRDLWRDNVHLNENGITCLAKNYLKAIYQ